MARRARATMSATGSTSSRFWLTTPTPARRARGEEEVDLFAHDPHDVPDQVLARAIRAVGDALHPHDAGEQIGSRQRDLDRRVGERADGVELVHGQRTAAAEPPEERGVAHL